MEITPTPISEITNAPSSADLYGGGTASVIPVSSSAQYMQDAAMAQAGANKYIAEAHEKNVTAAANSIADLGAQIKDVVPEDMPAISDEYAGLLKDMARYSDAISDPASDIAKNTEFKSRLGALQAHIYASHGHNAILKENQTMLLQHPTWNTAENQQQTADFVKTPLAQRKSFLLKAPDVYDGGATASKVALDATAQLTDEDALSKNGNYIVSTKGVKRDPKEYLGKFYEASAWHRDAYGNTDLQNLQKTYDQIQPDANGNKETFDQFWKGVARGWLSKDHVEVTMKANPVAEKKMEINAEYGLEGMREKNARLLEQMRVDAATGKAAKIDPQSAAETKAYNIWNAAHGNGLPDELGQNMFGSDPAKDFPVQTGGGVDPTNSLNTLPKVVQKIPTREFVKVEPDPASPGNFLLYMRDNKPDQTNPEGYKATTLEPQKLTFRQLEAASNGMLGAKNMAQLFSGSAAWYKKALGTPNPTLNQLDEYFQKQQAKDGAGQQGTTPTGNLPTISSKAEMDALAPGTQFIVNGVTYTKK